MEVDYSKIYSEIKRKAYKYLGSGSGRAVFDLNNGTVIKVAANKRGLAQNYAEYKISSVASSDLFAKVLCVSEDFRFLIMEKAEKVKDISFVWKYFNVKSNKELRSKNELLEIAQKYSLVLWDFGRAVNWGKINERPVIIDYGFTKAVKRKFY
jgi:hypothetical protein